MHRVMFFYLKKSYTILLRDTISQCHNKSFYKIVSSCVHYTFILIYLVIYKELTFHILALRFTI